MGASTDIPDRDMTEALVERVRRASATRTPLRIAGGGTKRFFGRAVTGEPLELAAHTGVVSYDPAELVITVRAGTRLDDVDTLLRSCGQHLPFEPPRFGEAATIGGTVAAGLAGPARVARGPVRDYVLGARMLTGDGRVLRFGGEVMKNVAGYDVARMLAGSLGVLGVILDVSLKVLPCPRTTRTLRLELDASQAIAWLASATQGGAPITASHWHAGRLHARLEGSEAALDQLQASVASGTALADEADRFWEDVREQRHAFFEGAADRLWRVHVPANAPTLAFDMAGPWSFEWHGAQRWLRDADGDDARAIADAAGGHATLFRGAGGPEEVFAPLSEPLLALHRNVKRAFDPAGILNPGRMYAAL
jgi:glycolate oxidase FAD binding subunit